MRFSQVFILLILFSIKTPVFASQHSNIEQCSLRYAWNDWSPYMDASPTGASGFQIDLVRWVAEELGCKLIYSEQNWADTLQGIKEGTIDFTGRASMTNERKSYALFSLPYRDEILVLYVRKGLASKLGNKGLKEILQAGYVLGLEKDVHYGDLVENLTQYRQLNKNIKYFREEELLVEAVVNNQIDVFFASPFTIDNSRRQQSLYSQVEEYSVEIIIGQLHFMFSKKTVSDKLVKAFNRALKAIAKSEKYRNHWYWRSIKSH